MLRRNHFVLLQKQNHPIARARARQLQLHHFFAVHTKIVITVAAVADAK